MWGRDPRARGCPSWANALTIRQGRPGCLALAQLGSWREDCMGLMKGCCPLRVGSSKGGPGQSGCPTPQEKLGVAPPGSQPEAHLVIPLSLGELRMAGASPSAQPRPAVRGPQCRGQCPHPAFFFQPLLRWGSPRGGFQSGYSYTESTSELCVLAHSLTHLFTHPLFNPGHLTRCCFRLRAGREQG